MAHATFRATPRLAAALTLAALTLTATACSSTTPATPQTTPTQPTTWDPCTIPDTAITQAGLDPSTKDPNAAGAQYEGWKTCRWQPVGHAATGPTSYYVVLLSTNTKSISNVRSDPQETHLADITVGDRPALQSQFGHDNHSRYSCDITFATNGNGIVDLTVDGSIVTEFTMPVCDIAKQTATSLLPALPH